MGTKCQILTAHITTFLKRHLFSPLWCFLSTLIFVFVSVHVSYWTLSTYSTPVWKKKKKSNAEQTKKICETLFYYLHIVVITMYFLYYFWYNVCIKCWSVEHQQTVRCQAVPACFWPYCHHGGHPAALVCQTCPSEVAPFSSGFSHIFNRFGSSCNIDVGEFFWRKYWVAYFQDASMPECCLYVQPCENSSELGRSDAL